MQLTKEQLEQQELEICLKSFEPLEKVAAENPHISAREIMRKETLRKIRKGVNYFIQKDYSKTIGNFLGGETFKIKPKSQTLVQLNIWANK